MCLIVWKEGEEALFTNRQFKNMISRNSDGLGIMWREGGRVKVDKVLGSPKEKFKLFQKHRNKPYFAMHARLKTHGLINLDNCHPYEILNIDKGDSVDLYLMHNGVLSDVPDTKNNMSDTWHFVEYVIKPIAKANLDLLWNSAEFQTWLSKKLAGSKLLLMRSDTVEGQAPVLIFNEHAGTTESGCWLSNTYSTKTYHTNYNYHHVGGNAGNKAPFQKQEGTLPRLQDLRTSQTHTQNTCKNKMHIMGDISETMDTTDEDKGKIIDFFRFKGSNGPYSIIPDENLYKVVLTLQGQPLYQIRLFVLDDPDLAADIIMAFYEKNTLDYETIIKQIKDRNTIGGIVDILYHVSQTIESIVKTRNVN